MGDWRGAVWLGILLSGVIICGMEFGTVTKICPGGFFVVRYRDDVCAAFSGSGFTQFKVGDIVEADLDKVGPTVMHHKGRNDAFEVFAHTGQSCLIACLLLAEEKFRALNASEERAFAIFYGESQPATLAGPLLTLP